MSLLRGRPMFPPWRQTALTSWAPSRRSRPPLPPQTSATRRRTCSALCGTERRKWRSLPRSLCCPDSSLMLASDRIPHQSGPGGRATGRTRLPSGRLRSSYGRSLTLQVRRHRFSWAGGCLHLYRAGSRIIDRSQHAFRTIGSARQFLHLAISGSSGSGQLSRSTRPEWSRSRHVGCSRDDAPARRS